MARLVRMTDVLPEDIDFQMPDGRIYTAPGDPPLTLILRIANLYEQAANGAQENGGTTEDAMAEVGIEILNALDEEVLALLQMRAPELERSPFGVLGVMRFVEECLKAYNFAVEGEDGPPTKAGAATRGRSKPSNGSRSSSTSSASRTTTT